MSRKKTRERIQHYHKNEPGGYDYDGACYCWENASDRVPFLRNGYIRICLGIGLMILAGCLPAPGADHAAYILLPYAAGVVAGVLSLLAFIRLSLEKEKLRDYVYDSSVMKLPGRLVVSLAGSAAAGAAQLLYIAVCRPEEGLAWALVYALCELAAAGLFLSQKKKGDSLSWIKE